MYATHSICYFGFEFYCVETGIVVYITLTQRASAQKKIVKKCVWCVFSLRFTCEFLLRKTINIVAATVITKYNHNYKQSHCHQYTSHTTNSRTHAHMTKFDLFSIVWCWTIDPHVHNIPFDLIWCSLYFHSAEKKNFFLGLDVKNRSICLCGALVPFFTYKIFILPSFSTWFYFSLSFLIFFY